MVRPSTWMPFGLATLLVLGCGQEDDSAGVPDAADATADAVDDLDDEPGDATSDGDGSSIEDGGDIPFDGVDEGFEDAVDAGDAGDPIEDVTPRPTTWHTRGQRIIDPEGRTRILHGFNLSNDVKHAPYESWAQEEDYARLQEWGVSGLRLLTTWAAIMPDRGVIDEEYLTRYDQRIEWAGRYNILVVIDMHQDVFGEGFGFNGAPSWACDEALYEAFERTEPWFSNYNSPQVQECYGRFWADTELQDYFIEALMTMAERYIDRSHVIGIDLFNEPYRGPDITTTSFARYQLQPFYERILTALADLPDHYLYLIEPPTVVQWGIQPGFVPFEFDHLVYAPHFYHPGIETEHEYNGDPYPIELALESYQETAETLDMPWLLGEWGGYTDSVQYDLYMSHMLGLLDGYQAGDMYYDYTCSDGGYSPLDGDGNEKAWVVDRFARVYPKAVGGQLVQYAFDEVSRGFTITLETLLDVDAPTILAFPEARQYPEGFSIESSDVEGTWSWEIDSDRAELSFTIDREVLRHTVTIRPL